MMWINNKEENEISFRVRNVILAWGERNMRDFPWRHTRDPYKILIAEIMLHRTKAEQVKRIYGSFIMKYPDIYAIADARPEALKNDLKSLGLSYRGDMLYRLAVRIIEKHNGNVPGNVEDLISLPGIGNYAASAIMCSAYNSPAPFLDTNTVRIISRVYGIKPTDSSRRSKEFKKVMNSIIRSCDTRKLMFSMIDYAAIVCTPHTPECSICGLNEICNFYNEMK